MKLEYFKKLANQSLYSRREYPMKKYSPEGCSLDQIRNLEARCKVALPSAYNEYLFLMGADHQLYDSGIGFCFDELADMQEQAQFLLQDEGFSISKAFWVVDILYNDNFHFIYLDESENPPVYHWIGSDQELTKGYENGIKQVEKKFSTYILDMVPSKLEKYITGLFK